MAGWHYVSPSIPLGLSCHVPHHTRYTQCHIDIRATQEKEEATKLASDATATPHQPTDGGTENRAADFEGQGHTQPMAAADGRADLDAYIKSLLSTPATGEAAEEQEGVTPPPGG